MGKKKKNKNSLNKYKSESKKIDIPVADKDKITEASVNDKPVIFKVVKLVLMVIVLIFAYFRMGAIGNTLANIFTMIFGSLY